MDGGKRERFRVTRCRVPGWVPGFRVPGCVPRSGFRRNLEPTRHLEPGCPSAPEPDLAPGTRHSEPQKYRQKYESLLFCIDSNSTFSLGSVAACDSLARSAIRQWPSQGQNQPREGVYARG